MGYYRETNCQHAAHKFVVVKLKQSTGLAKLDCCAVVQHFKKVPDQWDGRSLSFKPC